MPFLAVSDDLRTEVYRVSLEQPMSVPALLFTVVLILFVFARSRPVAITAIIAAVAYLPQTEVLNLGFHFYAIRFVLLAGIIRILIRRENRGFRWTGIDKALLTYTFVIFTFASLRAPDELAFRSGGLYDALLGYFNFRFLLKDEADFRRVLEKAAYVILPFAFCMLYETLTNHNFFSFFHGIDASSWIRNGSTRAQATFRDPITAGAFGATFAMLYASLRFSGTRKSFVFIGLIASGLIVFSSHSSGPFLGLTLGLLAFLIWPMRRYLKQILWSFVGALFLLNLVMKVPVWFLISRVSEVTGGGGYHRAELINQAVNFFDRWWFAGTGDTSDWFPYSINGGADITNFFVLAAVNAGIAGLFAALALIVILFKTLGRASAARLDRSAGRMLLWGLGASLIGSLGILFSITYMDQMQIIWYFFLASIAALAGPPVPRAVVYRSMPVRELVPSGRR
jgi:hypothetical protein